MCMYIYIYIYVYLDIYQQPHKLNLRTNPPSVGFRVWGLRCRVQGFGVRVFGF